jgi:hypothetical protein
MKNIFLFVFSTYFLFAGIGYNVAQYCCIDCSELGLMGFSKFEENQTEHSAHDCCSSKKESTCHSSVNFNSCHFFRVSVDTPDFIPSSEFSKVFLHSVFIQKTTFLSAQVSRLVQSYFHPFPSIPITGRLICTLNAVFLI